MAERAERPADDTVTDQDIRLWKESYPEALAQLLEIQERIIRGEAPTRGLADDELLKRLRDEA